MSHYPQVRVRPGRCETSTQLGLAIIIGPVAAAIYVVGGVLAWRSPLTRDAFAVVLHRRYHAAGRSTGGCCSRNGVAFAAELLEPETAARPDDTAD